MSNFQRVHWSVIYAWDVFSCYKRVFVCSVDCKQSVLVPQPETISHSRLGET